MKLISCAALVFCAANFVMAAQIVEKCTGFIVKKCPDGYKMEWRGDNPVHFDCYCSREELSAEANLKSKEDKCYASIEKCYEGGESIRGKSSPCSGVVEFCEKDNADSFCSDLKERGTTFQCDQLNAQKPSNDGIKDCSQSADECYRKGYRYANSDSRSESCEDLIKYCSAKEVRNFCSSRDGKFQCSKSAAYKTRRSDRNTGYSPSL